MLHSLKHNFPKLLTTFLLTFFTNDFYSRVPIQFKHQVYCEDCGKSFSDHKQMELHTAKIHGDRNFVCDSCSTGFRTDSILRNHMELHHKNELNTLACLVCHKVFSKPANLRKHQNNHTFNITKGVSEEVSVKSGMFYILSSINRVNYIFLRQNQSSKRRL